MVTSAPDAVGPQLNEIPHDNCLVELGTSSRAVTDDLNTFCLYYLKPLSFGVIC